MQQTKSHFKRKWMRAIIEWSRELKSTEGGCSRQLSRPKCYCHAINAWLSLNLTECWLRACKRARKWDFMWLIYILEVKLWQEAPSLTTYTVTLQPLLVNICTVNLIALLAKCSGVFHYCSHLFHLISVIVKPKRKTLSWLRNALLQNYQSH